MLQVFFKGVIDGAWKVFGKGGRPHFFSLRLIQKYVVMSLCVCVFFVVCVVCKCFQRRGAPAIFSLWMIHRA